MRRRHRAEEVDRWRKAPGDGFKKVKQAGTAGICDPHLLSMIQGIEQLYTRRPTALRGNSNCRQAWCCSDILLQLHEKTPIGVLPNV